MSWPLLLSQKALLPEAQSLALLQASFRLRPKRKDSSYPLPPPSLAKLYPPDLGRDKRDGTGDGPERMARTQDAIAGRQLAGLPGQVFAAARLACLFLSFPFTKFSHIPAACAAAVDSPVGRSPHIVCAGSEDPRCPEGLGTLEPSIPSVTGQHAPGALP